MFPSRYHADLTTTTVETAAKMAKEEQTGAGRSARSRVTRRPRLRRMTWRCPIRSASLPPMPPTPQRKTTPVARPTSCRASSAACASSPNSARANRYSARPSYQAHRHSAHHHLPFIADARSTRLSRTGERRPLFPPECRGAATRLRIPELAGTDRRRHADPRTLTRCHRSEYASADSRPARRGIRRQGANPRADVQFGEGACRHASAGARHRARQC